MTTSTDSNFNSNDLARRLITNLTNFSNAVSRLAKKITDNRDSIIDEMCRHKKETEQLIKSQKKYLKNIEDGNTLVILHQQKLMEVLECIVHHHNLKDQEN